MGTSFMKRARQDGSLMRAARASSQARACASMRPCLFVGAAGLQTIDQHQSNGRLPFLDLAELREIRGRPAREHGRLRGAPQPQQRARHHRLRGDAQRRRDVQHLDGARSPRRAPPRSRRPRPGSRPGRCAPRPPCADRPARRSSSIASLLQARAPRRGSPRRPSTRPRLCSDRRRQLAQAHARRRPPARAAAPPRRARSRRARSRGSPGCSAPRRRCAGRPPARTPAAPPRARSGSARDRPPPTRAPRAPGAPAPRACRSISRQVAGQLADRSP